MKLIFSCCTHARAIAKLSCDECVNAKSVRIAPGYCNYNIAIGKN